MEQLFFLEGSTARTAVLGIGITTRLVRLFQTWLDSRKRLCRQLVRLYRQAVVRAGNGP